MPAQLELLLAFETLAHKTHAALNFFAADLSFPLEGSEGLGHKGRERGCNLQTRASASCGVTHGKTEIGNGGKIFISFCGQPDHEVEFDLPPAVFQQFLGMEDNVLMADALVDDIAKPLTACFRGESAARAAQFSHCGHNFIVNGAHAQGGERKRHLFAGTLSQRPQAEGLER